MYHVLLCIVLRSVEAGVHIDKDLVAASATPLVLAILAEGENYGYAILESRHSVQQRSKGCTQASRSL